MRGTAAAGVGGKLSMKVWKRIPNSSVLQTEIKCMLLYLLLSEGFGPSSRLRSQRSADAANLCSQSSAGSTTGNTSGVRHHPGTPCQQDPMSHTTFETVPKSCLEKSMLLIKELCAIREREITVRAAFSMSLFLS